jgi:HAD-hyrolase-like
MKRVCVLSWLPTNDGCLMSPQILACMRLSTPALNNCLHAKALGWMLLTSVHIRKVSVTDVGMLQRAAREHSFDLAGTVIVGDSDTDMLAGRTAGTGTILLSANDRRADGADAVVKDLGAAARIIICNKMNPTTLYHGQNP